APSDREPAGRPGADTGPPARPDRLGSQAAADSRAAAGTHRRARTAPAAPAIPVAVRLEIGPAPVPAATPAASGPAPAGYKGDSRARSAAADPAGYTAPRAPGGPPGCAAVGRGAGSCRYRGCRPDSGSARGRT